MTHTKVVRRLHARPGGEGKTSAGNFFIRSTKRHNVRKTWLFIILAWSLNVFS